MVTFFIVAVSVFTYGYFWGLTSRMFYHKVAKPHFKYESDEKVGAFLAGMVWPFVLPGILPMKNPNKTKRPSRDVVRRRNEIEEAKHLAELAKIRFDEANNIEKALQANKKQNPLNV